MTRPITTQTVNDCPRLRSAPSAHALGNKGTNDTCQNIAHAPYGHRRVAMGTDRNWRPSRPDQGAPPFQYHHPAPPVRQLLHSAKSVRTYGGR